MFDTETVSLRSTRLGFVFISDHSLWESGIRRGAVVVDLGANRGAFSHAMLERGCKVIAVEPSPATFATILEHPRLEKFNIAIGDTPGVLPLHISDNPEATSLAVQPKANYVDTIDITVETLPDFCARVGVENIDILKIDIEGAEIGVLSTLPESFLAKVGQVTVEFHAFTGVSTNAEVDAVISRMRQMGFVPRWWRVQRDDVLFINTRWFSPLSISMAGAISKVRTALRRAVPPLGLSRSAG